MYDIICPNCNKEIDTDDFFENFDRDGDEFDENCQHCDYTIRFKVSISVDYEII
ncbi:hypothetical protein [Acinetobacter phage AB1I1M-1]